VSTPAAGGRSASTVAGASPSTAVAPAAGSAAPAPPPLRASITDPAGDQGQLGPAYADVREVRPGQSGDLVKVTVVLGGRPPAKLPSNEVMGVGVNFFHDQSAAESDYQLFADGEPDGWFAYLQTPSGFVKYPGTFDLASDGMTFTVPASALGDLRHSLWSAFVDWSRSGTPSSTATTDHAPDAGRVAVSR